MNHQNISIRRALISVSDKRNIIEFARGLTECNIEIISTGGTSQLLREAKIPVRDVSDMTGFPEIMDGRVKTLHPKVHGGILGKRDTHLHAAQQHDIDWIDLVIVNLYPFAETIKKATSTLDDAIENIDIGGPTMIRSAAKNMDWVSVVVDPEDYAMLLAELHNEEGVSYEMRRQLATKAFAYTSQYDSLIYQYLDIPSIEKKGIFPQQLNLHYEKFSDLRYGENPHQAACAYQVPASGGILSATQHQGKQLSYNNIADADAAVACVNELTQPACVIVKHANPCGAAIADSVEKAFQLAYDADSQSAFGGIIAVNQPCTRELATLVEKMFFEVMIAPSFSIEALEILANKKNLRVLECRKFNLKHYPEFKFIDGGLLVQDKNNSVLHASDLKVVTQTQPSVEAINCMLFAWRVLKHIKSNAILIAKDNVTRGVGAGQVSRIDAVDLAMRKAGDDLSGTILASDAFFPFRDSIDRIAGSGIQAIIQPGGSVRDEEVIEACNEHGISMVFTGERCFKH